MSYSKNDYYPFGMMMPGRNFSAGTSYRHGFNGKENDNDVKGEGNIIDFGARTYDPRIGRWMAVDPLRQIYTSLSPYNFSANNPVNITDADGNILKDKNGKIIATSDARVDDDKNQRQIPLSDGSTLNVSYKYVTIYTDKGNPVSAKVITSAVIRSVDNNGKMTQKPVPPQLDPSSNCHGYAFTDGKLFLNDDKAIKTILNDEYKYLGTDKSNAKSADLLLIYRLAEVQTSTEDLEKGEIDPGVWDHTAKREKGKSTFTDKNDEFPKRYSLTPEKVEAYDKESGDQSILYYKKAASSKPITTSSVIVKNGIKIVSQNEAQKIVDKVKQKSQ